MQTTRLLTTMLSGSRAFHVHRIPINNRYNRHINTENTKNIEINEKEYNEMTNKVNIMTNKISKLTIKVDELNKMCTELADLKETPPKNIYTFMNTRPFITFFLFLAFLNTIVSIVENLTGNGSSNLLKDLALLQEAFGDKEE